MLQQTINLHVDSKKTGFLEIDRENSILLKIFLGKQVFVLIRKPVKLVD